MYKNIYEVLDDFRNAVTDDDKIQVLQKNSTPALLGVLKGTYDPTIEYTIDKVPFYKPSDMPIGFGWSSMGQELSRVYLFQKNNPRVPSGLTDKRKELILINILESLEKREAEVFMNMLLKDQRIPTLTVEIINRAFPGLIPQPH